MVPLSGAPIGKTAERAHALGHGSQAEALGSFRRDAPAVIADA
jgi:hypothetical protein